MGFYEDVRRIYGNGVCDNLKKWRNCVEKLALLTSRRNFLLQCRRKGLFPNHINNYVSSVHNLCVGDSPFHKEMERVLVKFKKGALNIEVKATIWKLQQMNRQKYSLMDSLSSVLPDNVFRYNVETMNILREATFLKNKYLLEAKMRSYELSQGNGFFNNNRDLAITNLTDVEFPMSTLQLLSLGEKFAVECDRKEDIPVFDIVGDLEKILSSVAVDNIDVVRSNCVNIVSNHVKRIENAPSSVVIQKKEIIRSYHETKNLLKKHKDIVVCKSDKGGNTVIMKQEEYTSRMKLLLDDKETYSTLARDPSSTYRAKVNKVVDDLLAVQCIDLRKSYFLKSYTGVAPRIYGLPKLHKVGCPLRPIVSFINSPTYNLSKYVETILSNFVKDSCFNIKNSLDFKMSLSNQMLDESLTMISLDVKSLFTNIPLDVAFRLIDQQWDKYGFNTGIPKQLFLSLLKLVCDARYFMFQGLIYQQIFGLPMGSPVSPVLANIVMTDLLKSCLTILGIKVRFIKLYVDDLYLIIENGQEQAVLDVFNSYHDRLQFTIECEANGMLPFLDLKVIRGTEGALLTDWYCKPTGSGRILNFQSSHIMSQKVNCVQNIVKKVIDVSSPCYLVQNKKCVKELLAKNGYPSGLIDRHWNKYLNANQSVNIPVGPSKFFKFPYVHGLSESVKKLLRRDIPEVTLAFYNQRKVGSLFSNLKDPVPKGLQSNVVYSIRCNDCNQKYYGETSRFVSERSYQHKYSVRMKKSRVTALAHHAIDKNHSFDFPGIQIVVKEPDEQKRKTLEMLFIKKDPLSLNFRSDIDHLSNIYSGVLDRLL